VDCASLGRCVGEGRAVATPGGSEGAVPGMCDAHTPGRTRGYVQGSVCCSRKDLREIFATSFLCLSLGDDVDACAHFDVFEDLPHDAERDAYAAVGGGVAFDVFAAVQADARAGKAHPVFEGCPDVAGFGAMVFASIASPDHFFASVEFAEDGGAFVSKFFCNPKAPHWGVLVPISSGVGFDLVTGTGGTGGIDGDLVSDVKPDSLLGDIDDDFGVAFSCFVQQGIVFVNAVAFGVPAGVVTGSTTVTGMFVRLPAPRETMSLENETDTPGSSVVFSSSTTS